MSPSGLAFFHPLRVKSGIFCGIEPERTDRSDKSRMQLQVTESYTSISSGRPE